MLVLPVILVEAASVLLLLVPSMLVVFAVAEGASVVLLLLSLLVMLVVVEGASVLLKRGDGIIVAGVAFVVAIVVDSSTNKLVVDDELQIEDDIHDKTQSGVVSHG